MQRKYQYFLRFFLPTSLLIILSAWYLKHNDEQEYRTRSKAAQHFRVERSVQELRGHLEESYRNLFFVASSPHLERHLAAGAQQEIEHCFMHDLKAFVGASQLYAQIRWIDETGKETVRIDLVDGKGKIIPKDKLQNKAMRYYFADTMALEKGQVFISPLDLNIEHGEIEIPHKPILRFATPLFDGTGNRRGIIILNYQASIMLEGLVAGSIGMEDRMMLLNQDGYWLKSDNPREEWGFMFNKPLTMKKNHPGIWQQIRSRDSGQIIDSSGLWTWRTIYPLIGDRVSSTGASEANGSSLRILRGKEYAWIAVSHVEPSVIMLSNFKHITIVIFLMTVLSYICWRLAISMEAQARSRENLEKMATTDTLTGLFNRRYFMDQLTHHWSLFKRRKDVPVGVLMLDIDHFKLINDTYGHAGGDEALKHFSNLLKSAVRETDTVGRYGGEEFVVVLPGSDVEGAKTFAERIRALIGCSPVTTWEKEISFTVSIGVSMLQESDSSVEQVLYRADEALYKAKESGRNQVQSA